jgi:16S rRNA (guanine527-N7)-methyltransferase
LPAPYHDTLDAGLAELGVRLSDDARRAIDDHVRLLLAWNASINLTAIRDPEAIARLHVLDSLTALPLLRSLAAGRLLDLGSGAGYPGLPLAVALPAEARLVDSVGKKVAFLAATVAATGLAGVVPLQARAETLAADRRQREAWPLVTARAVTSLAELVELSFPLLRVGGSLVAWKRGDVSEELDAAGPAIDALGGGQVTLEPAGLASLPSHQLVVIRKSRGTDPGWPRDPAVRRRQPW